MKCLYALMFALLAALEPAGAATLYRWTDASGVARYGYQPPPGVEAEPAEEERRELYEAPNAPPVQCRDLADQHVALVDKEIARVRAMKAGLGSEFELTPAAKQELILDLLAHRAALITGRTAAEFRTPTSDELLRASARLQGENMKLRNQVKSQEATIDVQQNRLKQARRELAAERYLLHPWGPGYYSWPLAPFPIRR
jgi:ribosomal protein L29